MRDGYRILDADRHVIEPIEIWTRYLPVALRNRAPYLELAKGPLPGAPRLMLDGQPVIRELPQRTEIEVLWRSYERREDIRAGTNPEGHLRDMNHSGIDVAFLFPTYATFLLGIDSLDATMGEALAMAYNEWLREFCRAAPERLRGVGLVSRHDPGRMVSALERILHQGFRAVVLPPNPVKGRALADPSYEPFWAECERAGVAVVLHGAAHLRLPTAGADRFETRFALHACAHPLEQMMALLSLIEGGVLERHPGLRVGLLEAGCGWLPYWLHRLDEVEYRLLAGEVEDQVRMPPTAYFRRQCFVAFEPGEPGLDDVLRQVGDDRLLFGTDYPHLEYEANVVSQALQLEARFPGESIRKLLWGNAARFFGLNE